MLKPVIRSSYVKNSESEATRIIPFSCNEPNAELYLRWSSSWKTEKTVRIDNAISILVRFISSYNDPNLFSSIDKICGLKYA